MNTEDDIHSTYSGTNNSSHDIIVPNRVTDLYLIQISTKLRKH